MSLGITLAVLLSCLWQVGLGARYSSTGEQLGMAVPVSTIVLFAALAAQRMRRKLPVLPVLSPFVPPFLASCAVGVLAGNRSGLVMTVKELFQLAEVFVFMPWLVQSLQKSERGKLVRLLGFCCPLILILLVSGLHSHPLIRLSRVKAAGYVILPLPMLMHVIGNAIRSRSVQTRTAEGAGFRSCGLMRLPLTALLVAVSVGVAVAFPSGGLFLVWMVVFSISAILCLPGRRLALIASLATMVVVVSVSVLLPGRSAWHSLSPRYDAAHPTRTALETRAAFRAPRRLPLGGGLGSYKESINRLKLLDSRTPHPADLKVMENSTCQYLLTLVETGLPAALVLMLLLLAGALRGFRLSRVREAGGEETIPLPAGAGAPLAAACLAFAFLGVCSTILSRGIGLWAGAFLGLTAAMSTPLERRVTRLAIPAAYLVLALGAAALWNAPPYAEDGESRLSLLARHILHGDVADPFGLQVVPVEPADQRPEDTILVEAESGTVSAPFALIPATAASGGRVLSLPQNAEKGEGTATYQVSLPHDGTYRLSAYVRWEDGCSNSMVVQVGSEKIILSSTQYGRWHTVRGARPIELKSGAVPVTLLALETGIQVDYWQLTPADPTQRWE